MRLPFCELSMSLWIGVKEGQNMENQTVGPLARKTDLTIEQLPSETVVYDHKRHRVHCLNHSTSFIWACCDGRTTIEDMAARLPESGLPPDPDIVRHALKALERARLLASRPAALDATLPSRRMLVRRLGAAAGSVALLPVITSIIAPTPAMAQSGDSHADPPKPKPKPKPPKRPH